MCRVCLKRPEMPEDRFGRCETCAKSGRTVYRFRIGPARTDPHAIIVKAGELSPRAMREKLRVPRSAFSGHPSQKGHLGLHEVEVVLAKERLETVRVSADLAQRGDDVMEALKLAAERTEGAW